jgi:DNA-binding response OmpR family regulator
VTEHRYAVVIEDDVDTRELIDLVLTQSGFTVVTAEDGRAGIEAVRKHQPMLTTLDVQMPGMDGFAVAKRLREFSLTYLIMLTSMASEIDIIQGFEAGADDYLVKPFRPRELRARADAMLRRMRLGTPAEAAGAADGRHHNSEPQAESWAAAAARELREPVAPPASATPIATPIATPAAAPAPTPAPGPVAPPAPPTAPVPAPARHVLPEPSVVTGASVSQAQSRLEHAGLTLDSETGRITYRGRQLDLTAEEVDLLTTLLLTGRRVRSKADLVLALRGYAGTSQFVNEADKRRVDTHITNLRAKLGHDASSPQLIETVRGVGYRLSQAS